MLAEWLGSGPAWGGLAVGLFGGIVSGLLGVSSGGIQRYEEVALQRLRRGGPRATDPVVRVVRPRWRLAVARNKDAPAREPGPTASSRW